MNTIILFSRPDLDIAPEELYAIFSSLNACRLRWHINRGFAETIRRKTDITIPAEREYDTLDNIPCDDSMMISYGGDGTFLEAVRLVYGHCIPILGINHGHLGFLANTPRGETGRLFENLCAGKYEIQPRTLLEISGDFPSPVEHPYALNEFTIHRSEINMTYADVFVDGDRLATYRGDGVLISTPTGSTAYSLSVGGPIVAPMCGCFVVAPIAPHNLTMRPMVIPDSSVVRVRVNSRARYSSVSIDNRSFKVLCGAEFFIKKAEKSIFLVNPQNISFYDTLRNKMMWGLDGWDKHR